MSGILKPYFDETNNKTMNISACKFLTSYNQNRRLFDSGLLLSENNILKINKKAPNTTIKSKKSDSDYYIRTETNPFNSHYFYPKKNSNTFYEEIIFSNVLKKRQNKSLRPIYNLISNLTINKNKSSSKESHNKAKIMKFPYLTKKKNFNKNTISNFKINAKPKNNQNKSLTIKNNKNDSIEVEKIVNHLITGNNNNNNKTLHHVNSLEHFSIKNTKNLKYPMNNSISPITYIKYHLKKNPQNKEYFRSFDTQLKCLNNKAVFRKAILSQVDTNYRHRLKVENLKNECNNNDYYMKEKIEDIFLNEKNDIKNNFHFNLNDYYNNIPKNNMRYKFNKNAKLEKIFKDNNKHLITFYKRLNNFETSTLKTIKHLDSLSHDNRKMLKNILNIYKIYDVYEK